MSSIEELVLAHEALKQQEKELANKRRALASEIATYFNHSIGGQKLYCLEGMQVTVKVPFTRTMDWDKWETVKSYFSEETTPVYYKPELDMRRIKNLQENNESLYQLLARALTVKPSQPQIMVREIIT